MPLSRDQLAGVLEEQRNYLATLPARSLQQKGPAALARRSQATRSELTKGYRPEINDGANSNAGGVADDDAGEPSRPGQDYQRPERTARHVGRPHETITVLVADDHTLFREGIVQMCHTEADLEVIGEADDTNDAITLAQRDRPDVVLLDVEMPGLGADESLRQILKISPTSKVIVLTMHDDARLVKRLLSLGARAYVVKSATRDELLAAIRTVKRGKDNIVLSVSKATMEGLREPETGPLSARELEILTFVARGYSNAQIASTLYISEGTVKRHLTNIYLKLDVTSRLNAVNKAAALGLLPARGGAG